MNVERTSELYRISYKEFYNHQMPDTVKLVGSVGSPAFSGASRSSSSAGSLPLTVSPAVAAAFRIVFQNRDMASPNHRRRQRQKVSLTVRANLNCMAGHLKISPRVTWSRDKPVRISIVGAERQNNRHRQRFHEADR